MSAGGRSIEVAGLCLSIGTEPPPLTEALSAFLGLSFPASSGLALERVRFEVGPNAAVREGEEIVVRARPAELGGALRGMLVLALDPRKGALLHAAGVVIGGKAILCIAPSEGGKTTLCRKIAARTPVLSDETIALWLGDSPSLAGTFFWSGDPLLTAPGRFPLAAICFLTKGGVGLVPIQRVDALRALLSEWHLPVRPRAAPDAWALAEAVLERVPIWRLLTLLETDPLPLLTEAASRAAAS